MKGGNVELIIKPDNESAEGFRKKFYKDVKQELNYMIRDGNASGTNKLYVAMTRDFVKCITQKRLELLWAIKNEKPESLYKLAKLTDREFEPVKKDVKILEKCGLISLKVSKAGRGAKMPICNVSRITIPI